MMPARAQETKAIAPGGGLAAARGALPATEGALARARPGPFSKLSPSCPARVRAPLELLLCYRASHSWVSPMALRCRPVCRVQKAP